jgi:hypothetical protein
LLQINIFVDFKILSELPLSINPFLQNMVNFPSGLKSGALWKLNGCFKLYNENGISVLVLNTTASYPLQKEWPELSENERGMAE